MEQQDLNVNYCVISEYDSEKANYAKTELIKYIYLLTGVCPDTIPDSTKNYDLIFRLLVRSDDRKLTNQGYRICSSQNQLSILACEDQGLLYGVYGLLSDHYGIGFSFSGDAIPATKSPLPIKPIHETCIPKQHIRGILPWTNFPQSATSYSTQDWIYIIDQMTRMRMNFINIHNYNGEFGHNEMFHNIMINGEMSRNWNATVSKPHSWDIQGWDVKEYLFGGKDLFDDYDFGADAALHNDCLDNIDVFKKGSSQFQFILKYAHKRGVKIGLGLDLNLIPAEYGFDAGNETAADARISQILCDYPDLDYLLLYRSENSPDFSIWNRAFLRTYRTFKERAANIKIAVSGWGLDPDTIVNLPEDVIIAPISGHSVNDKFPDGRIYGNREFWACPWVERDYDDSIHFAPYNTLLSRTIQCYQNHSPNTKGLMTLTWRLSDGVDAKISYIARAPWDHKNRLSNSYDAYRDYAVKYYGKESCDTVTEIINENEAFATNASECVSTPKPSGKDRTEDLNKANAQIRLLKAAISQAEDPGYIYRLEKLLCRISAVKAFCSLDMNISAMNRQELEREFSLLIHNFIRRIDDISTLGNLFSVENRYVKEWYLPKNHELEASDASTAKNTLPGRLQILVISPITALSQGNSLSVKATVIGSCDINQLQMTLYWKKAGTQTWHTVHMIHRARRTFGIQIPTEELPCGVIEYFIKAEDNIVSAVYPPTAPALCMAVSNLESHISSRPQSPRLFTHDKKRLRWSSKGDNVLWYRIYRGTKPDFEPGPQSLLTYVYRDTLSYLDYHKDFEGKELCGTYYYKISSVDIDLKESLPSDAVACEFIPSVCIPVSQSGTASASVPLPPLSLNEDICRLYLEYSCTNKLLAELICDTEIISKTCLFSTGSVKNFETGELNIPPQLAGQKNLQLVIHGSENVIWNIKSIRPMTYPLREKGITTSSYSFALTEGENQIQLKDDSALSWSLYTPGDSLSEDAHISQEGLITSVSQKPLVAVATEDEGSVKERLISFIPKRTWKDLPPFQSFEITSEKIGIDENVIVGGLTYGYEYSCRISEETSFFTSFRKFPI